MGMFCKLIQYIILILSSISSPCIITLLVFWAIVLLTTILLLFRIYLLKFSRYIVIGNQLTHIFSTKCDPSQSILPVRKASKCSDKTVFQTTTWCLQAKAPLRSRAFVLRLRYCISKAHQVKYSSCSCETFRPLSPSLCMHKLIHKQCWHNPIIHLVLTSRAYFFALHDNLFYLFRYSLISIHSVEKNSTIPAVVVIPNTLWLNAPMFNTYDVGQMWHWFQ